MSEAFGEAVTVQDYDEMKNRRPRSSVRRSPVRLSTQENREQDLESRERELLHRELELLRRENEHLRLVTRLNSGVDVSAAILKVNLSNLKEIVSQFDGNKGSYTCWKE